jgi:hypothetical protein
VIRLYKPPLLGEKRQKKKAKKIEEKGRGKMRRGGEETFKICST